MIAKKPFLKLEQVDKSFNSGGKTAVVLKGIDLSVERG